MQEYARFLSWTVKEVDPQSRKVSWRNCSFKGPCAVSVSADLRRLILQAHDSFRERDLLRLFDSDDDDDLHQSDLQPQPGSPASAPAGAAEDVDTAGDATAPVSGSKERKRKA